ncbi:MAG: aminopeptidase N [Caenibius sp.]
MDIASSPELAADTAAANPPAPQTIRRADYLPFPWHVRDVALDFALGVESTSVTAQLQVTRNLDADPAHEIRLNGDGLTALSVKVDGADAQGWRMDGADLIVPLSGDSHLVAIETQVCPDKNSQLMGLYASNGMLCTQCEAEGFRRITFFPDRPDVLSTYRVRMEGDKARFPVLLSNGNKVASGEGADGTHWAQWHDPWPKPSYLFALVAGDLVANTDRFVTCGGRTVDLAIWVREGDLERTGHAMRALKASMKWDEDTFGREYDLDTFNIVAVSDFNMGAMENKGLNIFNTRYVLADPETATDADYDGVEGVIAHEYFHNWSGNRVTCKDWFQLSLKEGFTVLRDQLFSQDMGSEAVKRIEDVRILRSAQFPEDSGPLAHPIRPDSYQEISNFYTATVYNKGAEVIRMMRTMAGPQKFREGCDLYFARHDGQAATCEDFVKAMEDGAGLDLAQFRLWYSQAGTPKVGVAMSHSGDVATLRLTQSVPATPGQADKKPMPVPLRLALFDRESGANLHEELVVLSDAEMVRTFDGFAKAPVLSINRGFSAPVTIDRDVSVDDLVFLAAHDDDPFARYEAMQALVVQHLVGSDSSEGESRQQAIAAALGAVLGDPALDDLMRGELMALPGETYLAEQLLVADPGAIHAAREGLKAWLGRELGKPLVALHERASVVPFSLDAAARGSRKVKTQALVYLAAADPALAAQMAATQYRAADNMTDRQGALMVLAGLDVAERDDLLADFRKRYDGNALVIDKWFSIQAGSLHADVLDHVKALAAHPDFTLHNPNRVRSLYMALAANPQGFHAADGAGYRMIADLVIALDPINPQTAARFIPPLGRWRRIEPVRSALMRAELERIAAVATLSRDTREQVTRSLG